jgi:hypothetical protein
MKQIFSPVTSSKRGVTLLIAVLMMSVTLAVGMGVYNRTYKELYFSSFWKQTQIAAVATDGGLECALYWELHPAAATCFGVPVPVTWTPGAASGGNFQLDTNNGCVKVTITKPAPAPSTLGTHIEARGYNNTCAAVNAGTNPRTVERGLYVEY